MRGDDAVAAAGPDHRHVVNFGLGALAVLHQPPAKRLIGQDAGEIIDAAIAFGLADHGDDLVGGEFSGRNQILDAARVLHGLELDLRNFDRHSSHTPLSPVVYRIRGKCSPRSIFSYPSPRSIIGSGPLRPLRW